MGLIGANLLGLFVRKYSFGLIGNTIIGIFGSIFFIKTFGRLGIGPKFIMETGEVNHDLFIINIIVSVLGGVIGLMLVKTLKNKIDRIASQNNKSKKY